MSFTSLLNFGTTEIVLVSVFGGLLLLLILYLAFVPMKSYLTAIFSGCYVPTFKLLSLKNRKVDVANVVNSYIMAKKGGHKISLKKIESLVLSGGNATEVIKAMNLAKDSALTLDFSLASAIELASHNVMQIVTQSINSTVVEVDDIHAFAGDGIEIIAKARVSVKVDLSKYVSGLGLDDLKGTISSWILENISKINDSKDILKEPNKSLISNLDLRVVTQKSMYKVLDISIANVEVGRDLNAERELKSAEKEKVYAEIEAERMKNAEEIKELKMRTKTEEMKSEVLQAEADVPRAISQAVKEGRFSVMDYYKLMNLQADTAMRRAITNSDKKDDTTEGGEGDMF
jgi:uncharacterized protein YqfA (UPF0365 family)